jgi:outer membrane protein assembly factor BamA
MRTRLFIAGSLLALFIVGCRRPAPRDAGDEKLKAIELEGNRELSDRTLREGLGLRRTQKAGRAPDLYQVEVDAERLRGQYARAGFFEADIQSLIERDDDSTTVIYKIEEGKRSVTRLRITGLPADHAVTEAMVREKFPLRDGAPFDYEAYEAAKPLLLGVVQDAGYAHAELVASVHGDIATHTAIVTLAYAPGPKCTFGDVAIEGVDGSLRDAVRARLQFAAGDVYSTRAIAATQRAIYGLKRFSTVQIEPDPDKDEVVNVNVAVTTSAPNQVELGAGVGVEPTVIEVRGRAGYAVTRWPLPLQSVRIDLRPSYAYLREGTGYEPRMRARARLEHQDLVRTDAIGSVEVGYDYLAYEAFIEHGPQAQLGYEVQLGSPRLRLNAGYMIRRYGFRDTATSVLLAPGLKMELGLDRPERVAGFVQSLIADFRDQPLDPRLGAYAELKVVEGVRAVGSGYSYQQIVPDVRGYAPIGPVVMAARARFGAFRGEVPPTDRFYAGGSTSQRGFGERALSPGVTGMLEDGREVTVPYGGAALIDTSVEARFPITTIKNMPLGGVTFVDAGDVTETERELAFARLNWAVGVGLRLKTIVGPVRADVGYRLNRTGPDDPAPTSSRFAVHLSLGEAF